MKLLMKWAQFISNYQQSTLGGPMMKQSVLQSCFLEFNVLADVYICSLRNNSTPLLPDGTVKCTHVAA